METEDAPRLTHKKADEAVTYIYGTCPNFSAAARKEFWEAWGLLLLVAQSKADLQRLRPLDIL
jgi:hypothetical protein